MGAKVGRGVGDGTTGDGVGWGEGGKVGVLVLVVGAGDVVGRIGIVSSNFVGAVVGKKVGIMGDCVGAFVGVWVGAGVGDFMGESVGRGDGC